MQSGHCRESRIITFTINTTINTHSGWFNLIKLRVASELGLGRGILPISMTLPSAHSATSLLPLFSPL